MSIDHPNYRIAKIDQNTENLRGIAVIQIPVEDHQLTVL